MKCIGVCICKFMGQNQRCGHKALIFSKCGAPHDALVSCACKFLAYAPIDVFGLLCDANDKFFHPVKKAVARIGVSKSADYSAGYIDIVEVYTLYKFHFACQQECPAMGSAFCRYLHGNVWPYEIGRAS